MSQAGANSSSGGGGGGGITTLDADVGSATGSTILISGDSTGLTTTASGSTLELTGTLAVDHGGTGDTSFTAYSVITGGTTSTGPLQNVSGLGTSGQVLTSNGASALPTWETSGGGAGITTIDGDTGSITGSTVTIYANNATQNCGSSVAFVNSGTVSVLNVTDQNDNIIIGNQAGNLSISGAGNIGIGVLSSSQITSGSGNVAVGFETLSSVTTAIQNVAIGNFSLILTNGESNTSVGYGSGQNFTTGTNNTFLGYHAGFQYNSSESSNICIGNDGNTGESNTTRIGTQGSGAGQQNECFIAGIEGSTVSGSAVIVDASTGQLGTNGASTNTGQPAFSVYLSANQSNVTGNNTQYQIPFDTVLFDQTSSFNTGTGLYTYPVTGIYQHSAKLFVFGGSAASTLFFAWASYNAAAFPGDRQADMNPGNLGLAANGEFILTISWMHKATAGDTVGIFIDVIGGVSNDVGAGGGLPAGCTFNGFLVA